MDFQWYLNKHPQLTNGFQVELHYYTIFEYFDLRNFCIVYSAFFRKLTIPDKTSRIFAMYKEEVQTTSAAFSQREMSENSPYASLD